MRIAPCVALVLAITCAPLSAFAETAVIPVGFDYPLLRSLLVHRHFTDHDESAVVLNEEGGCRKVVLSHPQLTPLGWALRTTADVTVQVGVVVMGKCVSSDEWKAVIDIDQRIEIAPGSVRLRFVTLESYIRGKQGRSAPMGSILYALVKEKAHERMNRFAIDLTPLLDDLRAGLLDFVPLDKRERARKTLRDALPLRARADDDKLRLSFVVEAPRGKPSPPPPPLDDEELERFVTLWETWDQYLVMSALALSETTLSDDERRSLLAMLLETRSVFDEALTARTLERGLVRKQFEESWRTLGPLMRRGLSGEKALAVRGPEAILKMTPFFSASDALTALDRLGPLLGMEISVDGLTRLARMLSDDEKATLVYDDAYLPLLRKTFGMEPPATESSSSLEPHTNRSLDRLWRFVVTPAWAEALREKGKAPMGEIVHWLPEQNDRNMYVEKIRALLAEKRDAPNRINPVPADLRPWFARVIEATGWQESCFSQFKQTGDDYSYLRSYNGSSVGLMQINERVWRGLYEIPSLRWDIDYNAATGVDILSLYLSRFALPKAKKLKTKLSNDDLAGALYAMYNGGPNQFNKYLVRKKKGKLYETDRLFAQKFERVKKGEWAKVKGCYRRM